MKPQHVTKTFNITQPTADQSGGYANPKAVSIAGLLEELTIINKQSQVEQCFVVSNFDTNAKICTGFSLVVTKQVEGSSALEQPYQPLSAPVVGPSHILAREHAVHNGPHEYNAQIRQGVSAGFPSGGFKIRTAPGSVKEDVKAAILWPSSADAMKHIQGWYGTWSISFDVEPYTPKMEAASASYARSKPWCGTRTAAAAAAGGLKPLVSSSASGGFKKKKAAGTYGRVPKKGKKAKKDTKPAAAAKAVFAAKKTAKGKYGKKKAKSSGKFKQGAVSIL